MRFLQRATLALALLSSPGSWASEPVEACQAASGDCVADVDEAAHLQVRSVEGTARASWQPLDTKGTYPNARDEAGSYVWNDKLCLLGGRGTQPVDCLAATSSGTWQRSSSVTNDLHHVQPVEFDGKIYIVAGWEGPWNYEKDITKVLVYDPVADTITEGCDIPKTFRTGAAGVVKYKRSIYVIGGASGGHQKSLGAYSTPNFTKFTPDTCQWKAMSAKPRYNRDHFQAVLVGSKLVLAAGRDSPYSYDPNQAITFTTKETEIYDLDLGNAGTWQQVQDIPLPTSGNTAVTSGDFVYVVGGETDQNPTSAQCTSLPWKAHREVNRYDVIADAWTQQPSMITGRHAHGSAVLPTPSGATTLWSAAGVKCAGGAPTVTDTEQLVLSPPTPAPPTPPTPPTPAPAQNLALGRPAVSSSDESAGYPAGDAVDGSLSTRWSSRFTDNEWIYVELQGSAILERIAINWEAACASSYKLEGTNDDGATWFDLAGQVSGQTGWVSTDLPSKPAATWVRMTGLSRCTQYGYSIFEMEVYGRYSSPAPTPAPTAPPTPLPTAPPTPAPTPAPTPGPAQVNLALNMPVDASSRAGKGFGPNRAVDGDYSSRWASAAGRGKNEWLDVDLQYPAALSRIDVYWHDACATEYTLRGSTNGADYFRLELVLNPSGNVGLISTTIPASPAVRWVRLAPKQECQLNGGYSVYEMEVYGAYVQ